MKYDSVYTGVAEPWQQALSVYPNPASGLLTIDCGTLSAGNNTLEITDINGVKIFGVEKPGKVIRLNVEDYAPGVYFVKLNTGNSGSVCKFCKF